MKKTVATVGVFLVALSMTTQAQAATFTEITDVGATLGTASGTGSTSGISLTSISGSLSSATDADIYLINITTPLSFVAQSFGSADTQLFLFSAVGNAIYSNDDDPSGLSLQALLPSNNTFSPTATGLHYLAISVAGYNPVNISNQLLFADGLPTDILGPAVGVSGPLNGFSGSGSALFGAYTISLTSAATAVPEPSEVLGLLSMGSFALGAAFRRKLKRA